MDFGYKVIRNRLGSLVANAIQKKIENNVNIVVIKVNTIGSTEVSYSNVNVLSMISKGIPVIYTTDSTQFSVIEPYQGTKLKSTCGDYTLIHQGKTVTITNA